jgi:hypothetical protein
VASGKSKQESRRALNRHHHQLVYAEPAETEVILLVDRRQVALRVGEFTGSPWIRSQSSVRKPKRGMRISCCLRLPISGSALFRAKVMDNTGSEDLKIVILLSIGAVFITAINS